MSVENGSGSEDGSEWVSDLMYERNGIGSGVIPGALRYALSAQRSRVEHSGAGRPDMDLSEVPDDELPQPD